MFIYQADTYCESCGRDICERLIADGKAPHDVSDQSSYDSDDFPKDCGDCGESDSPCHCGSHEECLEAIELSDGSKVGALLGTDLTSVGCEYVKEAVREAHAEGRLDSVVVEVWEREFSFIDFDLPSEEDEGAED